MNKVLLSAVVGFLAFAIANNADARGKRTEEAEASDGCLLNGVYFAAGIGGSFYNNKLEPDDINLKLESRRLTLLWPPLHRTRTCPIKASGSQ
ncbi:hypothetical protein FACS1894122_03160 [Alphaproteobacteria bacterium]|nr:hypothetical protein FACS1894122_03160 [Alphaproteobacteria bacterium]